MLRHHLLLLLRDLLNHKLYALNTLGSLALGSTCFIVCGPFILDEFAHDDSPPRQRRPHIPRRSRDRCRLRDPVLPTGDIRSAGSRSGNGIGGTHLRPVANPGRTLSRSTPCRETRGAGLTL